MKPALLFYILLFLLSCENKKGNPIILKPIPITDYPTTIGHWTMCSITLPNGSKIVGNTCSTIIFYANGRGTTNAGGFTWALKKDTLYLSSATKDSNMYPPKGKYKTIFRKKNSPANLELDLTDSTKTIYHLTRAISIQEYL